MEKNTQKQAKSSVVLICYCLSHCSSCSWFSPMLLDYTHKEPHCILLTTVKNFLCSSAGENLVPEPQSQRKKINEEENDSFWWQQSRLYAEWLWLSEPNASSWPTDSLRNAQLFVPSSTSSSSASDEWPAAHWEPAAGGGLSVRLAEELLLNEHYELPVHRALQYERGHLQLFCRGPQHDTVLCT